MASITVLHQEAAIVQGMINNTATLLVDVNFVPYITFKKAVEKGLNPERWEYSQNANGNKILIEGVPYKKYIENMSEKTYNIDIQGNITSFKVTSMVIGDHTFDMKELGETLNELIQERRFKISTENFTKDLVKELSKDKNLDISKFIRDRNNK